MRMLPPRVIATGRTLGVDSTAPFRNGHKLLGTILLLILAACGPAREDRKSTV